MAAGVHAHVAEIMAEAWFEEAAGLGIERLAGVAMQHGERGAGVADYIIGVRFICMCATLNGSLYRGLRLGVLRLGSGAGFWSRARAAIAIVTAGAVAYKKTRIDGVV